MGVALPRGKGASPFSHESAFTENGLKFHYGLNGGCGGGDAGILVQFWYSFWDKVLYRLGNGSVLQWRHNERDGVSNQQPHDCWLNRLFKAQIK